MTPPEQGAKTQKPTDADGKMAIAVIDDEQRWLKVFERMFRQSNYAIDTFDNPLLFLDEIMKVPHKYAGIICDIKMPQMDGYQVFDAVKTNKTTRNIPFVIVSGVLTQDHNLYKIQGMPYISKLDDKLRSKIFQELIDVIENWPKVRQYLTAQNIPDEKIEFFCQFFINYHMYFNEILTFVNKMEVACVTADHQGIVDIGKACTAYMNELQETCMELICLMQESPHATVFMKKLCERGRTSINMIQTFQLLLAEEPAASSEFRTFLKECRDSLEKIIMGTEKGYNLRITE